MSGILLDTHALLWAWQQPENLSKEVAALILNPDTIVYASPVSAYEIAFKTKLGKLSALPAQFERLVRDSDFTILPITTAHFDLAGTLPLDNRDPWDRILSAQAILKEIPLVTCDARMASLGAMVVW